MAVAAQEGLRVVVPHLVVPHRVGRRRAGRRLAGRQVAVDPRPREAPAVAEAVWAPHLHHPAAVPPPALASNHRTAEVTTVAALLSPTELARGLHQASHRSTSEAPSPPVPSSASAARGCTASTHIRTSTPTASTTAPRA